MIEVTTASRDDEVDSDDEDQERDLIHCNNIKFSLRDQRGDSGKRVNWRDDNQPDRTRFQSPSLDRSRSRYQTPPRRPSPARFNCTFCESNEHNEDRCTLYNNRDSYWQHIQRKRWCSNCLRTGHRWRDCFKEQSCKLDCGRLDKHVPVLCDKYYQD